MNSIKLSMEEDFARMSKSIDSYGGPNGSIWVLNDNGVPVKVSSSFILKMRQLCKLFELEATKSPAHIEAFLYEGEISDRSRWCPSEIYVFLYMHAKWIIDNRAEATSKFMERYKQFVRIVELAERMWINIHGDDSAKKLSEQFFASIASEQLVNIEVIVVSYERKKTSLYEASSGIYVQYPWMRDALYSLFKQTIEWLVDPKEKEAKT